MTYTPCWPNFDPGRGQGQSRAGQGNCSWHKSPAMVFNYSTISASPSPPFPPCPLQTLTANESERNESKQTNKQTHKERQWQRPNSSSKGNGKQLQQNCSKGDQMTPFPAPLLYPTPFRALPLPFEHVHTLNTLCQLQRA